jgi:hypothetical protein
LVAYFAFDATPVGQLGLPVTNFTDEANIIVMFEGTPWEVVDTNYGNKATSYILRFYPYSWYTQIVADIKVVQSRGVKVLWNIDDATSWNTTNVFQTCTNQGQPTGQYLNAAQFAAFVKTEVIDLFGLDGIALDVEHLHSTPANSNYVALLQAFGAYFGPQSSNPDTIYIAAIYSGAAAGYAIGQSPTVAAYFNFVMDMGYSQNDRTRFYRWANYIGPDKTMLGMSYQYDSLVRATAAASWIPSNGPAPGIMVFAGNVDKPYTDGTFLAAKRRLTIVDLGDGSLSIGGHGVPNRTYRLQYTDALSPANWQDLPGGSATGDTNGAFSFTDTGTPGGTLFYRSVGTNALGQ